LELVLKQHMQLVIFAIGAAVLLAAVSMRSVELPWEELRIRRELIFVLVPLTVIAISFSAVLMVVARIAFTPNRRIG
jgi:hypothetical protein